MMPDIHVVHGDACETDVLEHAQIGSADLVIAATGDDEDNLVVAMLSKHFGSEKVFARINHPKNEWLFNKDFGVDVPVSSTSMMLSLVEKEVGFGDLITLLRLQADNVSIEEITLPPTRLGGGQDARGARAARRTRHVMAIITPSRRAHDRQGRHAARRRRRAAAHLRRRARRRGLRRRSVSARTRSSRRPTSVASHERRTPAGRP